MNTTRSLLSVVLLSACGQAPDFVTTHGISVFVDAGVRVTQEEVEQAIDISFDEGADRKPNQARELSKHYEDITILLLNVEDLKCSGHDEAWACATHDREISVAAGQQCGMRFIAHEIGHLLAWIQGDGDGDHSDRELFNTYSSLEVVGAGRIQSEVCKLVQGVEF